MILKASQRGGAKALALHLLRGEENEHVQIHEVRGFLSGDVVEALKEAQAVAKGTRCQKFLFSLSLSPPAKERVAVETFEQALNRIEDKIGLTGHPRVVVFHEKEGRRHAHCVWSRINAATMTAKRLSHFKLKLRDISQALYLEQGWILPQGLMNSKARDPRNFTLAEWQAAKRSGQHAGDLKEMMRECWAASDSAAGFAYALQERGFVLARGDRRGFVAVSAQGDILSVPRYTDQKAKAVKAKLGDPAALPGVAEAKAALLHDLNAAFSRMAGTALENRRRSRERLKVKIMAMVTRHRQERAALAQSLTAREAAERQQRAARIKQGLRGLWQRMTGAQARLRKQNEFETLWAWERDRTARDDLIMTQLAERRGLHAQWRDVQRQALGLMREIKRERAAMRAQFLAAKGDANAESSQRPSEQDMRPDLITTAASDPASLSAAHAAAASPAAEATAKERAKRPRRPRKPRGQRQSRRRGSTPDHSPEP